MSFQSTSRPFMRSRIIRQDVSNSAIFTGCRPITRRAESPRPMPITIRPPEMHVHRRVGAREHRRLARARVRDEVAELHRRGAVGGERQQRDRLLPEDVRVVRPAVLEALLLGELEQLEEARVRRVGKDGDAEADCHDAGAYCEIRREDHLHRPELRRRTSARRAATPPAEPLLFGKFDERADRPGRGDRAAARGDARRLRGRARGRDRPPRPPDRRGRRARRSSPATAAPTTSRRGTSSTATSSGRAARASTRSARSATGSCRCRSSATAAACGSCSA